MRILLGMSRKGVFKHIDKRLEFAGIALFGYGVFWIVLSAITLIFAGGMLNNDSLTIASQVVAVFAIIISVFYIVDAIMIWDGKLFGGFLAVLLVTVTMVCNLAMLVIGLGLLPFLVLNFAIIPSAFIILSVLGLAINLLIVTLVNAGWEFLN